MGIKIWHQSFTVLGQLPPYAAALAAHFKKVARPDTEVVMHGMHDKTYLTNYPGNDIRYSYMQYLHAQQFVEREPMAGAQVQKARIGRQREGLFAQPVECLVRRLVRRCGRRRLHDRGI